MHIRNPLLPRERRDLDTSCITLYTSDPHKISLPYSGPVPGEQFVSKEMYIEIEQSAMFGIKATLVMVQENRVRYLRDLEYTACEMDDLLRKLLNGHAGLNEYVEKRFSCIYRMWRSYHTHCGDLSYQDSLANGIHF